MTTKPKTKKTSRQRYSPEFKQQALRRAEQEGVAATAKDLGLGPTQVYAWRAQARRHGQNSEEQRLQQAELARLTRELAQREEELAFLKKAAAYFAREAKRGTP